MVPQAQRVWFRSACYTVVRAWKCYRAYSPPAALVPKLLPTTPVKVQDCPAAFVHEAVAMLPTLTQVTEAQDVDVIVVIDVMSMRRALKENMMRKIYQVNVPQAWEKIQPFIIGIFKAFE